MQTVSVTEPLNASNILGLRNLWWGLCDDCCTHHITATQGGQEELVVARGSSTHRGIEKKTKIIRTRRSRRALASC